MNIDFEKHSFNYTLPAPHTSNQSSQASSFASAGWSFTSASSSPASSREEPPTDFAFLVHSQSSVFANLPPTIDNKTFARQKRKRTSPEDQTILELEFQKNSKPDRHARRDIVSRVALSDREVQIWFQNRRQTARRKSLPLTKDAAAAPQSSSGVDPAPFVTKDESEYSKGTKASTDGPQDSAAEPHVTEVRSSRESSSDDGPLGNDQDETSKTTYTEAAISRENSFSVSEKLNQCVQPVITEPRPSSQLLRRTSSHLRLSTTSDGTAKILTADDSSPSPPKRAYVEAGGCPSERNILGCRRLFQRVPSGRSRDSRAWEFWCDVENRNGLLKKAEKFQTGSAADAIGLLRTSQRNACAANQGKQDSAFARIRHDQQSRKRRRNSGKFLDLDRVTSSQAWLQHHSSQTTKRREVNVRASINEDNLQVAKATFKMSSGDSDKENHEPMGAAAVVSQVVSRQAQSRALKGPPRLLSSKTAPAHHRNSIQIYEDANTREAKASPTRQELLFDPEQDEEISTFMKSGRKEEADMDCIRGLLSLSQGMWR